MAEKIEIELSGEPLEWLQRQVEDGVYSSNSAFIAALLQQDLDQLRKMLMEGLESGRSGKSMKEIIADIKAKRSDAAA